MIQLANQVKFKVLDSELEAIFLEAELIRTYQPRFNILLKDDKSPLYIHITNDKFPRVLKLRKKDIIKSKPDGMILGPFSSTQKTKEVLKIARKIFPWCNQKPSATNTKKPCFYHHIDLCPGACISKISEKEYQNNIKELTLFLRGKKKSVYKNLKNKMINKVKLEKFEEAITIRNQLKIIELVTKKNYKLEPELTTQALKNKISEDGVIYLQKIFSDLWNLSKQFPLTRIEGYDVSNTQGTNASVGMVVFINGKARTNKYRLFNIKTINSSNDYQMIKEAITRRQNHPEWGAPNLIVVDGGKGQIRSALKVWSWHCPIIGIAKKPDRLILPKINWFQYKTNENRKEFLKKLDYYVLKLDNNHPALKLVQQIRDESHRFSKKQHKKRRLKAMFD